MSKTDSPPSTSAILNAKKLLKAAVESLKEDIQAQEKVIKACTGEIAWLQMQPVSLADFEPYLRAHVEQVGKAWMSRSANILASRSHETAPNKQPLSYFEPEPGELSGVSVFGEFTKPGGYERGAGGFEALCYFVPDLVVKRLMEQYRETCGARWGHEELMPVAQRRERLQELAANLEAARDARSQLAAELAQLQSDGAGAAP